MVARWKKKAHGGNDSVIFSVRKLAGRVRREREETFADREEPIFCSEPRSQTT
jgi:hypothetical protein